MALSLRLLAGDIKPSEQVVFYPSLGWRVPEGWEVEVRGCVFEPESRRLLLPVLRRSLGLEEEDLTPEEKALFTERMRLFLVDHAEDRSVAIRMGGQNREVGPTGGNGHFLTRLRMPLSVSAGQGRGFEPLQYARVLPSVGGSNASGEVFLLSETGLSLISDIDDTIKLTQVRDRRELVRNTFCRPFRPVPGIAEFYRSLQQTNSAAFHYVSGGPWQLYQPLAEFLRTNGFPAGSIHLRHLGMKDGKLVAPGQSPGQYKVETIEPLLERYPHRRFLLVGDSGERDPEAYATLAKRHPAQIIRIYIRDVTGEPSSAERYRTNFSGLPATLWQVFEQPSQIKTSF